jgi:hypothetical protein
MDTISRRKVSKPNTEKAGKGICSAHTGLEMETWFVGAKKTMEVIV